MVRIRSAAAALVLLPAISTAQTIRGIVVDRGDNPVAGVVVMLVDSTSNPVGRALTSERGEFRLTASRAGTYRTSTLRIGFRPATSDAIVLNAGQEVTQRLVLTGVVFSLDTVRVASRSSCLRLAGDSAAATYAVWEQARTALTAVQLTGNARAIAATTVAYDRTLDRTGRRVLEQTARISSDFVTQPWRARAPDSLRRYGYVIAEPGGWTTYYAPGLDALLSAAFVDDHCFRLTTSSDASRLGIAFEPTSDRRRVAEIRGTLWLDRKSSELRGLEFQYANLPRAQDEAGGEMEFARMRNGAWAITRWNIRMPVLAPRSRGGAFADPEMVLTEIKVTGGELALATSLASRGRDTLWARPPLVLTGAVRDSSSGAPVPGAYVALVGTGLQAVAEPGGRFTITGVLPGEYTVEVRTLSLDSVNAVSRSTVTFTDSATQVQLRVPTAQQIATRACGNAKLGLDEGIVVGTVALRGDSVPPANVEVVTEWTQATLNRGRVSNDKRWLETRSDRNGHFRVCGVPLNTRVVVRATSDAANAPPFDVTIPGDRRFAHVDLTLDRQLARGAAFTGSVSTDSTQQPIADAEVTLPELSLSVLTNDRGEFRLSDVPAGTHQVVVRRLGYGPLDTRITFAANQTVDRRIFLSRFVLLDSVVTTAEVAVIPSFEQHRKIGLGTFITRAELAKKEGFVLSTVLADVRGLGLLRGSGGITVVYSTLRPRDRDGRITCFSQVYIDKMLMNPGAPTPAFNVNEISPDRIEAIEFYSGPSQTPLEYSKLESGCGVLVIHTRRK
jgi:hypothetical protein